MTANGDPARNMQRKGSLMGSRIRRPSNVSQDTAVVSGMNPEKSQLKSKFGTKEPKSDWDSEG